MNMSFSYTQCSCYNTTELTSHRVVIQLKIYVCLKPISMNTIKSFKMLYKKFIVTCKFISELVDPRRVKDTRSSSKYSQIDLLIYIITNKLWEHYKQVWTKAILFDLSPDSEVTLKCFGIGLLIHSRIYQIQFLFDQAMIAICYRIQFEILQIMLTS